LAFPYLTAFRGLPHQLFFLLTDLSTEQVEKLFDFFPAIRFGDASGSFFWAFSICGFQFAAIFAFFPRYLLVSPSCGSDTIACLLPRRFIQFSVNLPNTF